MPCHIKTYDGSEDPKDHLKIFQSAAKIERWAIPTWCHMFNSTLTRNARKKCIKDPVEIHNIRQRDGESMKEFVRRYKLECRDVKGDPECMKISRFMHEITNPELIKRLHDKTPKSLDKMIRITTAFLGGEVVASNRERKKPFSSWKQQESNQKQNFKKGGYRNQQRSERKQDRFSLLIKTPKEIFALDKGKFKAPPPMTTPVEKRNHAKFCEFHGEVGHNTDECMHLKKQIEEMLKAGKMSHLIKEIKQNNRKKQPKVTKKEETSGKDKALAILMVQPWERVDRQSIIQIFSPNPEFFFPPLGEDEGTKGPIIIEAKIGGHCVHHIGEIIWPIGRIQLLVKIGDEEHSTSAWMNFMVIRSSSLYNGIIGRPGVRKLQAVPSTTHKMLKILVEGGVITLKSSKLVPLECAVVSRPEGAPSATKRIIEERIKVAINPGYPEQTVMIGSTLTEEGRNKLCGLLQRNLDIFAWKPTDMTGVPRHIAEHRLNVREGCSPIGRNLEVYVDALVIKSRTKDEIVRHIEETFKTLREINMKLNPKKCTFGVEEGMFLGYKVNTKGLKVCPDKVDAVLSLPSPKCLKDVQKLNEKLASLNRFLAKSAEKSLPFFKTLKKCAKKSDFLWTTEAEEAFNQMKQLITELPMLTAPMEKEELIVYLAAAKDTV
ncbi:hypothetical protein Tco_1433147, partial [Tanacetum coccineum]